VSDADVAGVPEFGGHAQRTVGAAGGLVDVGDLARQPGLQALSHRVAKVPVLDDMGTLPSATDLIAA
jgi:hypothetical protein